MRIPPTAGGRPAFSLHQKIRDDTARSHPDQVTLAQRKVVLPVAAPALARPDVVLFDIFETVLQLEPLRGRLAEVGRPRHELELFFTRLLCDGMALTLAGEAPPFRDVAAAALCTLSGNTLSEESIKHVLDGFAELPPHPDVEPAWRTLADAGVPAWAFTHGSTEVARIALERAGLLGLLRGVHSAESIGSFKPPPRVYHWVCEQVGSAPERTALVAAHPWDTHGRAAGRPARRLRRSAGRGGVRSVRSSDRHCRHPGRSGRRPAGTGLSLRRSVWSRDP